MALEPRGTYNPGLTVLVQLCFKDQFVGIAYSGDILIRYLALLAKIIDILVQGGMKLQNYNR